MAQIETIASVLNFLINAYPRQEVPRETVKVYLQTLADIPANVLKAAALAHISTSQWFPSIAELRDQAAHLVERALNIPSAFEAWDEVTRTIRELGSYRWPVFSHPLIGKAVDGVGGWKGLCMSENQIADRARFFQVYEAYARRMQADHRMLPEVAEAIQQLAARLGNGENFLRLQDITPQLEETP